MSALKYWLWLSGLEAGAWSKGAVLAHYGSAQDAYMAPEGDMKNVPGLSVHERHHFENKDLSRAYDIMGECERQHIQIISFQDARYPRRLKNISAPPAVLYVKGKWPNIDDNAAIAVIGTRRATPYGVKMAHRIAGDIARSGAIVISGLTRGIDAAAAEGALLADGVVVAVLGTSHEKDRSFFAADVAVKGAVISEYPPGTAVKRHFFRERNRISAGLSLGVAAVEAPARSGTALFVEEAIEQGKEIFAVPSNADSASSAGTLEMLRDGAKLITCGWDAVSEFQWLYPDKLHPPMASPTPEKAVNIPADTAEKPADETKKVIDKENNRGYIDLKEQLSTLNEAQLQIISAIDKNAGHIDDIIEATGLPTATVLAQLTVLEIKGFVRREAGRRISLNTAKK